MTIRRLTASGCLFAVAALAISACQVTYKPAQPQKSVAAPSQDLLGVQPGPGKVVDQPPGQGVVPPGLMKNAEVTPPGQDGSGKALGRIKQNAPAADLNGRSKPGQAVPKGLANKPNQPALSAPGQAERKSAGLTNPQAVGPSKSSVKGKLADTPPADSRQQPKTVEMLSKPLPPAHGKPTMLLNKPLIGDVADEPDTASQAQQATPDVPGKAPGTGKGKDKIRQPI